MSPLEPVAEVTMPAVAVRGQLRLALSTTEVADLLFGRSDEPALKRVRTLITDGCISAASTGRSYLVSTQSVLAWLGATPGSPSPAADSPQVQPPPPRGGATSTVSTADGAVHVYVHLCQDDRPPAVPPVRRV